MMSRHPCLYPRFAVNLFLTHILRESSRLFCTLCVPLCLCAEVLCLRAFCVNASALFAIDLLPRPRAIMQGFEIDSLLRFSPPEFLCERCFAILNPTPDVRVGRCPICGVIYVATEEFPTC